MIKLQSPLNIRKGDQDREAENQQQRLQGARGIMETT
jgi:hypothetical protein